MRKVLPILTLFFCSVALSLADLKTDLQRRYDRVADGVAKSDVNLVQKALRDCVTSDFVFIDPFKQRQNMLAYSGLLIELALPNGPKTKRFRILSVRQKGDSAIAILQSQATDAKGKKTVRTSTDSWIRSRGKWLLKKIEFTSTPASVGLG